MVQRRWIRQRATIISSTRTSSAGVAGWKVAAYSSRIFWNRLGSSHWSKTVLWAVKPWLVALSEDFARVAADFGPLDFAPLARAVSDFSLEGIVLALRVLVYTQSWIYIWVFCGLVCDNTWGLWSMPTRD